MALTWKKRKSKETPQDRILPQGYYDVTRFDLGVEPGAEDPKAEFGILIVHKPFTGVKFILSNKIKIREDSLTGAPQLLYDYKIVDYAGQDPVVIESSTSLSRIIAAIAVEILSSEIDKGGSVEISNQ